MISKFKITTTIARVGAWCALVGMPLLAWACLRLSLDLASQWSPAWLIDDAMLLTAASFAALVATYLSVIGAAFVASSVAGARGWAVALARLAPHSWQRVASIAVGFGLATGVAAPSLASDDGPVAQPNIAWVATEASPTPQAEVAPESATPTPSVAPPSQPTEPTPPSVTTVNSVPQMSASTAPTYTVVRGDSLWEITEGLLGPAASESDVAHAWPELYDANRTVVGADPGLIFAGQVLVVPASIS